MKFMNEINLRDHAIKWAVTFFWVLMLAACGGGGGGSTELIPGHALPNALYSTASSAVTLISGATQTYSVGGGTPYYSVSSSNPGVATASISGSTLTIASIAAGTAQITVFDAIGSSVSTTATVGSGAVVTAPIPLFATVPSAVTLATGATASFTIAGGTPPYLQSSSNTGVATANVSGNSLTISGIANGTAQVSVFDSTGTNLKVSVTVGSSAATTLYMTAPSTITSLPGVASTFAIGGGSAPYTVSSSNASVATAAVSGTSSLAINAIAVGTAQLVVFDSTGASVSTTLSVAVAAVPATTALYVAAPGDVTIAVDAAQTYNISGGTTPYTVISSNVAVASASGTANSFTITGIKVGAAQIVVFDAAGKSVTVNVTVGSGGSSTALFTTAPSAVTLASGASVSSYSISGGTAPYSASSSNEGVARALVSSSTLNLTSIGAGSAKVIVSDALGATVEIAVTVTSITTTPTALIVQPSASTANVGDVLNFSLSGGSPPYSVMSNNISIATVSAASVSTSGGTFTATLRNVGATTIAIVDTLGQTTTLTLTVNNPVTMLRLSPSTVEIGEDYTGVVVLSIYGGTGPYTAYTSDLVLTGVSTSGSALTVGLGSSASRCINPVDVAVPPNYIPSGTYDVLLTAVDSLGASATSKLTIRDNGKGLSSGGC